MTEPFSPKDRLARLEAGAPRENAQTALVRRYFEMWNTGEGAVADQVLSPRYVDHAHPAVIGPAAARSIAPRFHKANGRMSPEILGADAEFVAVRNKIRKTHDGKAIEVEGKALFRIDEDRIVEQWSWYSSLADKARLFRDSARSI